MKVAEKRHRTEFEVQADAYFMLKEALGDGYRVHAEYTYNGCRFDLAVFDAQTRDLICTLEIKKKVPKKHRETREQIRRYECATGKPSILVTDNSLRHVIAHLKRGMQIRAKKEFTEPGLVIWTETQEIET